MDGSGDAVFLFTAVVFFVEVEFDDGCRLQRVSGTSDLMRYLRLEHRFDM